MTIVRSRLASELTSKVSLRFSASCRNERPTLSRRLEKRISSTSTLTVPDSIFDEIENVADEVQQIGSGSVNGSRKLHLFGCEVTVRILTQLLTEDENAVERRPKLVRHVRQKFRFVFRSQCELRSLLLECAAGLLDFLILALHFHVSFRELLGFLRELLVGLLQLLLLCLKLHGQLLRLLEQALRFSSSLRRC